MMTKVFTEIGLRQRIDEVKSVFHRLSRTLPRAEKVA
jgi:hypothetical protein